MNELQDAYYTADQIYSNELQQIKALSEDEERAIYERIRNGDIEARCELVTPNLPFAAAFAKRFKGCGIEYEDLRQLASVGLMAAADRFDPNEGATFRTFAVYYIKAVIIHEIEAHGRAVRIPSHIMQAALKYRRFVAEFHKTHEHEPSDYETAVYLGFSRAKIEAIQKYMQPIVSLDLPLGDEDGDLTMGDTIETGEDFADDIADEDERQRLHDDMERLLDELPQGERDAVRGRYYRGQTYAQIAQDMNVSESEARNMISKGLRDLRKPQARRLLIPYIDYCIDRYAYKSSFTTWQETGSSSTERAVLKALEREGITREARANNE